MDAASLVCCLDAATPDVEATETPIKFGLQHFVLSAIHREIPSLEESEIPLTSTAQFDLWAIRSIRPNGPLNSLSEMPFLGRME